MKLIRNLSYALTLQWLYGPIFEKEVRVSARQKRSYFMRSLYLFLLMTVMVLIWFEVMSMFRSSYYSAAYYVSRMAEASKAIAASIAWFQFIALQIVAIVICSTAVNSEIHRRTLYVLMTTPVTAFQIVAGKLLSRLWQVVILLSVGFPLLAMLRVFGGIPWGYLVSTLCITLSAVIFISMVTIFCSIMFKRAYVVMLFTVIILGVLFAFVPFLIYMLEETTSLIGHQGCEDLIFYTNPYGLMIQQSIRLFDSGLRQGAIYWPAQCGLLLGLSVLLLMASCRVMRRMALKHMVPKLNRKKYKVPPRTSKAYWLKRPIFVHSLIKHTIGTGVLWKEFIHPVLGGFRKLVFWGFIIFVVSFVVSILVAAFTGSINLIGFVIGVSIFSLSVFCVLFTIIIPATYITGEKEAGTWLVLLTTCYSDWQILGGKIVGILRRILLVWFPFLFVFFLVAYVTDDPLWFFMRPILAALIGVGFVVASGLYFSSRFKHTTAAVIWNLSLAGLLWVGVPLVLAVLDELGVDYHIQTVGMSISRFYNLMTPPGLIIYFFDSFDRPLSWGGLDAPWIMLGGYIGIHVSLIALFLWRAKANLRKRIS